jgi:ElaA protein
VPELYVARFDELDARQAYLLWALRESVFVVEQHCPYQELDGRDLDPDTWHVWVQHQGRPIGYLRLLGAEVPRIGRVLVAPAHRGLGLANTLLSAALDLIGDRPSELDAQSYLAGWYRRYGYEAVGPEFLDDGIPHVPMRRPAAQGQSRETSRTVNPSGPEP